MRENSTKDKKILDESKELAIRAINKADAFHLVTRNSKGRIRSAGAWENFYSLVGVLTFSIKTIMESKEVGLESDETVN